MTRDLCTAYECLNNYNIMCNETCFLFVLSLLTHAGGLTIGQLVGIIVGIVELLLASSFYLLFLWPSSFTCATDVQLLVDQG